MHCHLEWKLNFPVMNFCYPCLNNGHCAGDQHCDISSEGTICAAIDVPEPPSMYITEKGYNIFTADPLFRDGLGVSDPGHETIFFYDHTWNTDTTNRINLQNKDYFQPVGFTVFVDKRSKTQASTHSMTSSTEYKKSVEDTVGFGAEGSIKGVNLGGSAGVSSYKEIYDLARESSTVTYSEIYHALYSFEMNDVNMKLKLKSSSKKTLNSLTDDFSGWKTFFDKFGTHIITKGTFGAFSKVSYSFTSTQRQSVTSESTSFEKALSIGVPAIFNFGGSKHGTEATKIGNLIQDYNSDVTATSMGNINNLSDSPGLLRKTLIPICHFIDYSVFTKINSNLCYQQMRNYCLSILRNSGLGNSVCEFPSNASFQCAMDNDCTGSLKKCINGVCKKCRVDSDCGWQYLRCNSGQCVRKETYSDADAGCQTTRDQKIHWTSCNWDPTCPSGYHHLRWENGPCEFWTKRRVCRKWVSEPYLAPPCTKLLKGTCHAGNRGNGCCPNGDYCSKWGWCGWHEDWNDPEERPLRNQCRQMVGFAPY